MQYYGTVLRAMRRLWRCGGTVVQCDVDRVDGPAVLSADGRPQPAAAAGARLCAGHLAAAARRAHY
eukprot:COSAG01_NODE_32240_length_584_cov_1.092784_1_plen_65_part_10